MEIHRSNLKDNKRKNIGNSDSFSSTKSQPSKYSTISLAPDLSKLNPNWTKRKRNASWEIHKQKIFDYEDRLLNKKSCSSTKSIKVNFYFYFHLSNLNNYIFYTFVHSIEKFNEIDSYLFKNLKNYL